MEHKGSVSSWLTLLTAICCTHSHTLVWSTRVLCQVDWQSLLPFAAHTATCLYGVQGFCVKLTDTPYCHLLHTQPHACMECKGSVSGWLTQPHACMECKGSVSTTQPCTCMEHKGWTSSWLTKSLLTFAAHTAACSTNTASVTAGHFAPQWDGSAAVSRPRGTQPQRMDTRGRSKQPPNHPQPKPSPVHSAAGFAHQRSDSTASNRHAQVTLNLPKASIVRNHLTLPRTSLLQSSVGCCMCVCVCEFIFIGPLKPECWP